MEDYIKCKQIYIATIVDTILSTKTQSEYTISCWLSHKEANWVIFMQYKQIILVAPMKGQQQLPLWSW